MASLMVSGITVLPTPVTAFHFNPNSFRFILPDISTPALPGRGLQRIPDCLPFHTP
jgi:hypothetical protein